jgi:hypothetical protein
LFWSGIFVSLLLWVGNELAVGSFINNID